MRPEQSQRQEENVVDVDAWQPKTDIGRQVKKGDITNIDQIFDKKARIMEPEIVDILVPNLTTELLMVGQAKGKFGGGQERVFRQTQKKTREGNKPNFATFAVVGNHNGYLGLGYGKSKETVPAREKSMRNAKLNLIKIRRGNGTWEDSGTDPNTIPFSVSGKSGSVKITFMPAPRGTGLCAQEECQKMLKLAGVKDVWSKIDGNTKAKLNVVKACFDALKQLTQVRVMENQKKPLSMVEGAAGESA